MELKLAVGRDWKDEGYVFASKHGAPLDRGNALHRFQRLLANNTLPKIRFYDLRHTHASLLIAQGVHAKKIAERLGHASIKLTMDTYGHLFEGSDHESAERMDQLFGMKRPEPVSPVAAPTKATGANLVVISDRVLERHADKNADKTVLVEIQESVSA